MKQFTLQDFSTKASINSIVETLCSEQEIDVEIRYVSDFTSAKILREVVDEICKGYGIDPKWRTRLVLIIDELNNNAIEYGSNTGDINIFKILLRGEETGKYIQASVTDTGKGAHAKTASEMNTLRDRHQNKDFTKHHSIRGRGLFLIITRLVDSLYFEDSENIGLTVGIKKLLSEDVA